MPETEENGEQSEWGKRPVRKAICYKLQINVYLRVPLLHGILKILHFHSFHTAVYLLQQFSLNAFLKDSKQGLSWSSKGKTVTMWQTEIKHTDYQYPFCQPVFDLAWQGREASRYRLLLLSCAILITFRCRMFPAFPLSSLPFVVTRCFIGDKLAPLIICRSFSQRIMCFLNLNPRYGVNWIPKLMWTLSQSWKTE